MLSNRKKIHLGDTISIRKKVVTSLKKVGGSCKMTKQKPGARLPHSIINIANKQSRRRGETTDFNINRGRVVGNSSRSPDRHQFLLHRSRLSHLFHLQNFMGILQNDQFATKF